MLLCKKMCVSTLRMNVYYYVLQVYCEGIEVLCYKLCEYIISLSFEILIWKVVRKRERKKECNWFVSFSVFEIWFEKAKYTFSLKTLTLH